MPAVFGKIEGRGNGIKTVIPNILEVGLSLHRNPSEVNKFFGCELGSQTTYSEETERAVVNGAHTDKALQDLIHRYVEIFVLCPNCGLPETEYKIKNECIFHKCAACGAKDMVDMNHKLCTYILAQDKKAKKDKKDKEKKKVSVKVRVSLVFFLTQSKTLNFKDDKKKKKDSDDEKKKDKKDKDKKVCASIQIKQNLFMCFALTSGFLLIERDFICRKIRKRRRRKRKGKWIRMETISKMLFLARKTMIYLILMTMTLLILKLVWMMLVLWVC
jgi:translation initiation factor 5